VAALNLLRLSRITGNPSYEERAGRLMKAFADSVAPHPSAYCQLMVALDLAVGPSLEIVIAGREGADDTRAMIEALRAEFLPHAVILFRPEGESAARIASLAPYVESQSALNGAATAYVCRNFACEQPVTDPAEMMR